MVTSNEPAIYREGMHGVRHENIILSKESGASEFGTFLEFETLTCCHIDTAAVLPELLGPEALSWLNTYNNNVYGILSPYLSQEEAEWLYSKTRSI
jgi:Xaa-Pro aminopeptidase